MLLHSIKLPGNKYCKSSLFIVWKIIIRLVAKKSSLKQTT